MFNNARIACPPKPQRRRKYREYSYLCAYKAPLQLSRELYKSTLFMQNEPNFKNDQIYISPCIKNTYGNLIAFSRPKNEPKRTQNEPNFGPKLGSFSPNLASFFTSNDCTKLQNPGIKQTFWRNKKRLLLRILQRVNRLFLAAESCCREAMKKWQRREGQLTARQTQLQAILIVSSLKI